MLVFNAIAQDFAHNLEHAKDQNTTLTVFLRHVRRMQIHGCSHVKSTHSCLTCGEINRKETKKSSLPTSRVVNKF